MDMHSTVTQSQFAELIGVSQQAVSDLINRGVLDRQASAGQWLRAYCSHLREQAAGRASTGDLDLVQERARLAKEQADRVAMENAKERRELAPVSLMESTLSNIAAKTCGILEAIPVNLKRNHGLPVEAVNYVRDQIITARNQIATMKLELEDDDAEDDTEAE